MKSKEKTKKVYMILLIVCLVVMAGLVAGLFGYAHHMGTKTMGSRIKNLRRGCIRTYRGGDGEETGG